MLVRRSPTLFSGNTRAAKVTVSTARALQVAVTLPSVQVSTPAGETSSGAGTPLPGTYSSAGLTPSEARRGRVSTTPGA